MDSETNVDKDIEKARFNMIEQQIRPWDVLDDRILNLLSRVRREDFVPETNRRLAFVDMELPLGEGELMWWPRMEARAIQSLEIKPTDRVLEIGTGSGYVTALLASLAAEVVSVEINPVLAEQAAAQIAAHGFTNVLLRQGDAARDWASDGDFDVIILTGSTPVLSTALLSRLRPGGRLFAVVGEAPVMQAQRIDCVVPGQYHYDNLFETVMPPLKNAPQVAHFSF